MENKNCKKPLQFALITVYMSYVNMIYVIRVKTVQMLVVTCTILVNNNLTIQRLYIYYIQRQ
jgi:hypothetical protein